MEKDVPGFREMVEQEVKELEEELGKNKKGMFDILEQSPSVGVYAGQNKK